MLDVHYSVAERFAACAGFGVVKNKIMSSDVDEIMLDEI